MMSLNASESGSQIFSPFSAATRAASGKRTRKSDRLRVRRGDDANGPGPALGVSSAHVLGHRFQGTNGGRQGHALKLAGDFHQPFETGHELDPPAVLHHRVDLIENHRLNRGERLPTTHRGQQQVQALRRGDQQFRGPAEHALTVSGFGVAAAGLDSDIGEREPLARRTPRGSARWARRGSHGCRCSAPSAARCRAPGWPRVPTVPWRRHRWPRETPSASCRCPWAP